MKITESVIPNGMVWNEAELQRDDPLNNVLLMLLAIKNDLTPDLIGTAFIVTADKASATAISAAHCFESIRSILHPETHHHSTPSEFLPAPHELDLKQVKAVYTKNGNIFVCTVELAVWDSATDLAVLTILAPEGEALFNDWLWVTNKTPGIKEEIAMFGDGEMKIEPSEKLGVGKISRRLVIRVGKIEAIHPEGYYRLRAPCVQTSIQVYGGMSGGVIARWAPGKQIEPFAFISHSMTMHEEDFRNRAISGQSMGSILKAKITFLAEKKQEVAIEVNNIGVGRTIRES